MFCHCGDSSHCPDVWLDGWQLLLHTGSEAQVRSQLTCVSWTCGERRQDTSMAVCRKARCVKLTIIATILLTIAFNLFPQEFRSFLSQFAPPSDVEQPEVDRQHHQPPHPHPHHQQQQGEVVIQQRERHGESETFLTPGNLGNFEPMREEEGEGPGERGAAHHTKRGRGEDLLKNVA